MSKVVAGITTSVDGYIAGPNDGPAKGLGDGGERLVDEHALARLEDGTGLRQLTTDELAASRSGYPARPERKSGPCPLFLRVDTLHPRLDTDCVFNATFCC